MDRRPVFRIDSIEIGGARFSGVDALVGPQRSADGVIGLRLFANLSATLDYQKPELRLSRESLPADGPHVLSFRTPHGIPVINVTVAGRPAEVDVDSGSPTLLTVPAVMAKDVPFKG